MRLLIIFGCCTLFAFSSCIKDEAPNSEADILSFKLPQDVTFGDALVSNNEVVLFVKKGVDISNLKPEIEVSEGATISPSAFGEYDFSIENIFTVTSQDKKYHKNYIVKTSPNNYHFAFDDWNLPTANYPELTDGLWKSGNLGIWIMPPTGKKNPYPTRPTDDCVEGSRAVLLETLQGKEVWNKYYSIFSGSIYYGSFTVNQSEPPKGVRFGQPHPKENGKPIRFTGYYKYKPGLLFLNDKGEIIDKRVDECTVRAFLYTMPKDAAGTALTNALLTGSDDVLNSTRVIAIADLVDGSAKNEFTFFNLSFVYKGTIDYDLYDYRLAIVFASSKRGDFYEGAVGSTLLVDDVKVICEDF